MVQLAGTTQPQPSAPAPADQNQNQTQDQALDWRTLALGIAALLAQSPEPRPTDTMSEVARQLKAPVSTLRGQAARLMFEATAQSDARATREVAGSIVVQADLMAHWVDAILDVQRIQLGKLHLRLRPLDLAELVAACARAAGARVAGEAHILPVQADVARLRQAVSAVLDEAAASFGDALTVRLSEGSGPDRQPWAIVTVGNGAEVDPRRAARASFNLNLYFARELVCLHGGDLRADFDDGHVVLRLPLDFSSGSHTVLAPEGPSWPKR
jgi:K+-sensing histidine kinase KdpD